jgi:hypothetical protein
VLFEKSAADSTYHSIPPVAEKLLNRRGRGGRRGKSKTYKDPEGYGGYPTGLSISL